MSLFTIPVCVFVAVMLTPGINAPVESATVPPNVAFVVCGKPFGESNTHRNSTAKTKVVLITPPQVRKRIESSNGSENLGGYYPVMDESVNISAVFPKAYVTTVRAASSFAVCLTWDCGYLRCQLSCRSDCDRYSALFILLQKRRVVVRARRHDVPGKQFVISGSDAANAETAGGV